MCGIVGFVGRSLLDKNLEEQLERIEARGPDAKGTSFAEINNYKIGLGHVRLSIIDLSTNANQPFVSANGRFTIVYNGEVYNYKELRKKLVDFDFRSNSDTEVIIELFAKYGTECLNWLDGIFAFSILDREEQKVFIVRDQLGIKPLYYYNNFTDIYFCSELKGLFSFPEVKKELDENVFTEFFLNGFIYEPNTGFKDVYKVKPGEFVEIDLNKEPKNNTLKTQYWTPLSKTNYSLSNIEALISKTINDQTVSDVPVGLFFSGGIDSSVLLSELNQKLEPFIISRSKQSYEESGFVDDSYYAEKIANQLEIKLNKVELDERLSKMGNLFEQIEIISRGVEEPIADYTYISSLALSKEVREKGFKVMLSGMGADEIFEGYPRYRLIKYESLYRLLVPFIDVVFGRKKSFQKKIDRFKGYFRESDFPLKYSSLIGSFAKEEIQQLLKIEADFDEYSNKLNAILEPIKSRSGLKKAIYLDWLGFLSHNYIVADKSSMAESLEVRVPLSTKDLASVMFQSKRSQLTLFSSKKVLRKMLYKVLPKKLVDRKKTGFNPPMDDLIISAGQKSIFKYLEDSGIFTYLNEVTIQSLLDRHFSKEGNYTFKIFQVLFIASWYKQNFQNQDN
jgi:asparagine synthase (glutamine-hydrolysing)